MAEYKRFHLKNGWSIDVSAEHLVMRDEDGEVLSELFGEDVRRHGEMVLLELTWAMPAAEEPS